MVREEMRKWVARNINQLASDESTVVSGIITTASINEAIDVVHRDILFPLFSDKYPNDFTQTTTALNAYIATGTVSASSTSTTLVATGTPFTNGMVGYTVENADGSTAKITSFTSSSTVTLDTTIGDSWDGDTFYILGQEFLMGGDLADAKEIRSIMIKYTGSNYFIPATRRDYDDALYTGYEVYSKSDPIFYLNSVKDSSTSLPKRTIGILPKFTTNTESYKVRYVQKPPELADGQEPVLTVPGIGWVIVNGATAMVARTAKMWDVVAQYEEIDPRTRSIYPKGTMGLINSYKPKTRSRATGPRDTELTIAQRMRLV